MWHFGHSGVLIFWACLYVAQRRALCYYDGHFDYDKAPPDLEMALIDSQPVGIDPFEEAAMGHTSLGLTTVWDGAAYG